MNISVKLTDMIQVSVKLDDEDVRKIDEVAKKHGLTRADIIRMVIKDWIRRGGEIKL
jgi:predicted transcriptional regulator